MAIITYPLNGIEYDASDAETYLCTRTSGVFSAADHFAASVTNDREITISTGLAWINNDTFAGKSVANTEPVAVAIPVSDGALDRIDRIVLRFDKAANASSITLVKGTAASTPAAPAITQNSTVYELGLYTVYIPAASTTVLESNITDTRSDSSVCGVMTDGVTQNIDSTLAGLKYTISLEPDTADKAASVIRIKDNASGNTRAFMAASEDTSLGNTSQISLRNSSNTGRIVIQSNDLGKKGLRIIDENGFTRVDISHNVNGDTCVLKISDASGNDVTLDTIGAQPARLTFTSKSVATSAWASNTTYTDYPYRAAVACSGVTADMFAEVVLAPTDAASGNIAPVCQTYAGGVYLYAEAVPDAAITIPTIVVWR